MTTQKMYDEGLRCKGKGLNCTGCKDKKECVECIETDINNILVVDIEFKDGLIINNCGIFNNPKQSEMAIQDEHLINKIFQKYPWYARGDGFINFQNSNINGYFHVENVKSYFIKYINKYEI